MNTKQKLTLGIAAIFIVTLTIVGISYAYFVTRVQGTPSTSVNVQTAVVGVEYGDGIGIVTLDKAMPGDVIYKSFTVTNDSTVESTYQIKLTQTASTTEFLHFTSPDNDTTCYADGVTKVTNSNPCYSGTDYNDLKVTLVEYTGSEPVLNNGIPTEEEYQEKLASAFSAAQTASSGIVVAEETKLTAGKVPQNLGTPQKISAKVNDEGDAVVKTYILKVEFADALKNQSAEMEAGVTIKVDIA